MWEFCSSYDGCNHRWLWKYFQQGLLQETSRPGFLTMNDAILDANAHGFEKHLHRWQVITGMR